MHGMINRALQCFVLDTYGAPVWAKVVADADLGFDNFEAMLNYPDGATMTVLSKTARHLDKPFESILEDIGTYLVSHPNVEAIRRLLRFGGENYAEFLFSLNYLQDRTRMALPDLETPTLMVEPGGDGTYLITCNHTVPGFGYALLGVLRAMADDYGALVLLEHEGWKDSGEEVIKVNLLEAAFAEGRSFDLAAAGGEAS